MFYRLIALIILSVTVSACASAARVEKMVPAASAPLEASSPLASALCVTSVTGGEETNPLWTSEVDTGLRGPASTSSSSNFEPER